MKSNTYKALVLKRISTNSTYSLDPSSKCISYNFRKSNPFVALCLYYEKQLRLKDCGSCYFRELYAYNL